MTLFEDFLQVTVDGNDVSDYVMSYTRNSSLCEPGVSFTLGFTRKKFDDSVLDFDVSDPVVISEKYPSADQVLKGYITHINSNANNAELRVVGMDKYVLLSDFFIADRLETQGQSVAYWISYICGLVNLSVQFDTYPGIPTAGADGNGGTPLGMQRAMEALATLERKGAVYTRYDSDIDKIRVYTLTDAEPKVNINSSNLVTFDRAEGVKSTRNVVKVWGGHDYDWLTQESYAYNAIARTTMGELVVDQTFVLASPEVRSQTFANIIASRILSITATLDDIVIAECAGLYPAVVISNNASISISQGETTYGVDRMITSIGVSVSKGQGARTVFTFGEKCPRITITPPPYFVYATYEGAQGGAAVSYNAGDSFNEFNAGLPASGIPAQSIAANAYNQLMMVTTSGVYKRPGVWGLWSRVTALDSTYPSNDEGEYQFLPTDITFRKVEKEGGFLNRFHLLGQASGGAGALPFGQERWWAYFTPDYGYTWSSMQLYTPGSGIATGTSSGLPIDLINGNGITPAILRGLALASGAIIWNVHAHDMEGDINGNITVLIEGDAAVYAPENTVASDTFYMSHVAYSTGAYRWRMSTWWMDESEPYQDFDKSNWVIGTEILTDGYQIKNIGGNIGNVSCFSIPNNREVCYGIAERMPVVGLSIARTAGYRTNYGYQDVPEWERIYPVGTIDPIVADFFGLQSWSVLLDYSSLKPGSDIARWCLIGAALDNNSNGGDDYPSNTNIVVNCIFYEDDITASGIESCTRTSDQRIIGISSYAGSPLSYDGEGTYGWIAKGQGTASPVPRGWTSQEPMGQGAQPCAVTTNLTGSNKGYWAVIVSDTGGWHGDSRDAGWPTPSHPRDWEEKGTIGVYIVEVDLTEKYISNISLWQGFGPDFHTPPPDADQPQRDIDILDYSFMSAGKHAMMVQPNFAFFSETWGTDGHTNGHYLSYPGLGRTQYSAWNDFVTGDGQYSIPSNAWAGVRKTPFYSGTAAGYRAEGREDNTTEYIGESDSRMVLRDYGEATVSPIPIMPSGMISHYKGHPDFGYFATERRAVQPGVAGSDPMTHDHNFMWKAQRATPNHFDDNLGNTSRYTDPYAQTSYGLPYDFHWDFRTYAGSIMYSGGGDNIDWNWMSG